MKKLILATFVAVITILSVYCVLFSQSYNKLSDLELANIEALAWNESNDQDVKCSTNIYVETHSVQQGNTIVKISECRSYSCNYGKGGSCQSGQECQYFSGPFAGQTGGSGVTTFYCPI